MDPTQPVIPYAEPETARALEWRQTDDRGLELIVMPPRLSQQLTGLGVLVALLSAGTGAAAFGTVVAMLQSPALGWLMSLITFTTFGTWVVVLARFCRVARYGRLASVVRVTPEGLTVIVPSLGPGESLRCARAAITDVDLEGQPLLPARGICVRAVFRGGMTSEVRIPWRGGEPLEPVERRMREVLALPARES